MILKGLWGGVMKRFIFQVLVVSGAFCIGLLNKQKLIAFDIPVRYHAPAFQGTPIQTADDWALNFSFRYRFGSTRRSENRQSQRVELFDDHGPFNIVALGVNVRGDSSSLVRKYWPDSTKLFKEKEESLFGDFACNKKCAGVLELLGKYKVHAFDFIWRQNLLWGVFAHFYVPVKDVELGSICYRYCASTPDQKSADVEEFIKDDLDNLLPEHGLKPLGTPFKKTGFADPVFSFGWQGQTNVQLGIIDELKGMLMCGILFPWAAARKKDHVFSLPMGQNHHWGINARIHVEGGFYSLFRVGASLGILSLLNRTTSMRLKTDKRQNGWIMLEQALANEDAGAIWDISTYVAIEPKWHGLYGLAGFSFTRQESNHIHVRDTCFLKSERDASIVQAENPNNLCAILSVDDVVNSDNRLRDWEMYVLHIHCGYDMKQDLKINCAPKFVFHYDYPFIGKHTFMTSMFGGSIGLFCTLDF